VKIRETESNYKYKIFRNSYTSSCIRTTRPANSELHHFRTLTTYRPTSSPFRHSQRFNDVHNRFLLHEYTFELFKAYQSVQYYRARYTLQVSHAQLNLYTTVFRYYIQNFFSFKTLCIFPRECIHVLSDLAKRTCGRSRAGISGSNLAGDMHVCLVRVLCIVK
jgi:hypothetical protein